MCNTVTSFNVWCVCARFYCEKFKNIKIGRTLKQSTILYRTVRTYQKPMQTTETFSHWKISHLFLLSLHFCQLCRSYNYWCVCQFSLDGFRICLSSLLLHPTLFRAVELWVNCFWLHVHVHEYVGVFLCYFCCIHFCVFYSRFHCSSLYHTRNGLFPK